MVGQRRPDAAAAHDDDVHGCRRYTVWTRFAATRVKPVTAGAQPFPDGANLGPINVDSPPIPAAAERPPPEDWTGRRLVVDVTAVAHGGHCVARFDGRVLFVRHTLPGERVEVLVTEDGGGSFARADAVRVLKPAPGRVEAPCRYAGPGGCGGCDFQHVTLAAQLDLKATVVAEQLSRLAGLDREIDVQSLPPAPLGWRRRIRFAVTPDARLGLRAHRSHRIVPVEVCLIGAPGVGDSELLAQNWRAQPGEPDRPALSEVELAVDDRGEVAVLGTGAVHRHQRRPRPDRRGNRRGRAPEPPPVQQLAGPARLSYTVAGRDFDVSPGGFWQTHPGAAAAFTGAVSAAAELRSGDRVLDLYAGAGLFTAQLAAEVGPSGAVVALEGDRAAVADATTNLIAFEWATVTRASVLPATVVEAAETLRGVDVVVLDPPRTGAGRALMAALIDLRPRVIVYVACDPAALARDVRFALDAGWQLDELSAFDTFPMTHHVECVAALRPGVAAADPQKERSPTEPD
ncbi:MAG: SAM-dependent methyltransferase, tRNA(uracil-5)-methyltransferase [Frankiales bacterium]|nr:SAM-dependent methyltransferase, tRNA(uracil-5)-methyltransferase [Frankiales bacterium]